jgi:hypothetical protein
MPLWPYHFGLTGAERAVFKLVMTPPPDKRTFRTVRPESEYATFYGCVQFGEAGATLPPLGAGLDPKTRKAPRWPEGGFRSKLVS